MSTLSLFNTSSDQAGFRLNYMEVYNWGTFNEHVFKIHPQGNNSLLTGANASGKSTFIDALLTLLVPAKKDRFYNQSSGVDKKGDRTEETYVLGHYGNIQNEGENSTSTQKLRDKNCYSVILASFSNTDLRHITLFQVRWFSNGELRRAFGLAHAALTISDDFAEFDAKGNWKKRLDKQYNNQSKRTIEFFDGPTNYADRLAEQFGMRSTTALSLFNQVVGVKVLDDLDEFIRNNMLEDREAESEYLQLKESFLTLMDAKTNIEKAKEQIAQLTPIDELAKQIQQIQTDMVQCNQFKELGVYWFTQKYVELANQELTKNKALLEILSIELQELKNQEETLKAQERTLSIAIEKDEVGSRIEKLKEERQQLEGYRQERINKLDTYNQLVRLLELVADPSKDIFNQNKVKVSQLALETEQKLINQQKILRGLENEKDRIQDEFKDLMSVIQTLQKNKNNISGRVAEIRDEILEYTGASKEEIPFIAELIKVHDDELAWKPSIEKILHNFGLRLIVPEKYYKQVNDYVNQTNLRGRITYQRYQGVSNAGKLSKSFSIPDNALYHKLEFNQNSHYIEWLEDVIQHQFDYACVDSLEEFNHYHEKAVTQQGLIKFTKGKHEKDDRQEIGRKENFILGWDNQEKLALLKKQVYGLQNQQSQNLTQIQSIENENKITSKYRDDCRDFLNNFERFEDIHWQDYAIKIQKNIEEQSELEKTNDHIKTLNDQLVMVKKDLTKLVDEDIYHKNMSIYSINELIKNISEKHNEKQQLLNNFGDVDTSIFEQAHAYLSQITYQQIDHHQKEFQEKISNQLKKLNENKGFKESEVRIKINEFKNPSKLEITGQFKDWRSDVSNLPDSTHLDLIGEYQEFLKKLQNDNLPKFEKKFNNYLQETITNKIADFRMFFESWSDSIKENIATLNDSLRGIDFRSKDFKTYIQLVAPIRLNDEIKTFKQLLTSAIPNIREIEKNTDAQRQHFIQHIEPLIKKLDHEDWRKRVMQVRSWFNYKAEEFYREDRRKFKTYENMGQLSGGEKAQLTYTILGSAIAYQFGLTKEGHQSNSFRFIAIDEAFKAQDEDKARYLINLCKQLHLQLLVVTPSDNIHLVVTPSDNIHIVENDISFVHYVERKNEQHSWLYDMPIEQFNEEKTEFLRS